MRERERSRWIKCLDWATDKPITGVEKTTRGTNLGVGNWVFCFGYTFIRPEKHTGKVFKQAIEYESGGQRRDLAGDVYLGVLSMLVVFKATSCLRSSGAIARRGKLFWLLSPETWHPPEEELAEKTGQPARQSGSKSGCCEEGQRGKKVFWGQRKISCGNAGLTVKVNSMDLTGHHDKNNEKMIRGRFQENGKRDRLEGNPRTDNVCLQVCRKGSR